MTCSGPVVGCTADSSDTRRDRDGGSRTQWGEVIDRYAQPLSACQQTWLKLMAYAGLLRERKARALHARMPQANALTRSLTARILEDHGLW
jgi:hypothetical protein